MNRNIKWQKNGCYGAGFDQENHDLAKVARFEEYRGLLFASLNPAEYEFLPFTPAY